MTRWTRLFGWTGWCDGSCSSCQKSVHRTYVENGRALFFESIFAEYAATADSSRVDPLHNELTLMAAPFPA